MSSDYELLFPIVCDPKDITTEVLKKSITFPIEVCNYIDRRWKEETAKNKSYLFNGKVASLVDFKGDLKSLHLVLQETDYKSFFVTNILNDDVLAEQYFTNTLAICAVTITSDRRVIIGKRSSILAEGEGLWHVPGGTCDEEVLAGSNPFDLIVRELKEEFNIDQSEMDNMKCIGLGKNLVYRKPELLGSIQLNVTAEKVMSKMSIASDFNEHTEIQFVPETELGEFLKKNRISPIGRLCLERFIDISQIRR